MVNRLSVWLGCVMLLVGIASPAAAQQFNSDNQWTAPHGVGTFILTLGQEYSAVLAVAALFPDWEFNLGATRYREDPDDRNDDHYSGTFYVKHRFLENDSQTGGIGILAGTGHSPSYLAEDEVVDTFQSWWANGICSISFFEGALGLDLLPGVIANFDKDRTGQTTVNFSYSSRITAYRVVPHSAIVGEVFGTTGESYTPPQYRAGLRWESEHVIIAGSYGRGFDGAGGPRFELGAMFLTNPLRFFCLGGGCD